MNAPTSFDADRWTAIPAPALPVTRLVIGRPVKEVAETLPRVFNLCRAAQSPAVRLALGLSAPDASGDLADEIRREHLLRLCLIWPQHFGLPPIPMQADDLNTHLFGAGLPDDVNELKVFASGSAALAPLVAAVMSRFAPAEAVANGLPVPDDTRHLSLAPQENSVSARRRAHPLMQDVEQVFGRGPLWRILGRAIDLGAVLSGWRPEARVLPDGCVTVPAARGIYAVRARTENGRVTEFTRITPTDHMMADGGVMQRTLESLPPCGQDRAQAVVDLLDPCAPVTLQRRPHHA